MTHARMVPAALGFALAACGYDGEPVDRVAVRDSAGIRIVESSGPAWGDNNTAELSSTPRIRIGSVDGEPATQFSSIVAAFLQTGGGIVVVDGSSSEVRYFAADGNHVRSVGGKGGGPGEFDGIRSALRAGGDSLAVFDYSQQRLTILDENGELVSTVSESRRPVGRAPDGRWIGLERHISSPHRTTPGIGHDTVAVIAFHAGDQDAESLLFLPGPESFFGQAMMGDFMSRDFFRLPYGPDILVGGNGTDLALSDGRAFGALVFPSSGGRLLVRRRSAKVPVTQAMRDNWIEHSLGPRRGSGWMWDIYAQAPFPDSVAPFDRLLVSGGGAILGKHTDLPDDTLSTWTVFSPDGEWLGELRVDSTLEIEDVSAGEVLGIRRDELGVPYVEVFPMQGRTFTSGR